MIGDKLKAEERPLVLARIADFFSCGASDIKPEDDEVCSYCSCQSHYML